MISLGVFLEPRGILKVLQFVFVICAFACTCNFRGHLTVRTTCVWENNTVSTTMMTPTSTPTTSTPTTSTPTTTTSATTSPPMIISESTTTAMPISTAAVKEISTTPVTPDLGETSEPPTEVVYSTIFKYPFRLDKFTDTRRSCNGSDVILRLSGNYTPSASFYVFVGVTAFLYTIAAMVLYTWLAPSYEIVDWVPIVDLIVHAVFTFLWFAGSIAWASALTSLKKSTRMSAVALYNPELCDGVVSTCTVDSVKYQLLDFSVVFGFLNVILFGANIWFVYKETRFFPCKSITTKE